MFWDTVKLVTEILERYGGEENLLDLNGEDSPCLADYDRVVKTGSQEARYITLTQRPFAHINPNYRAIRSADRNSTIIGLLKESPKLSGPTLCLENLEREPDPFAALKRIGELLDQNGYIILVASFAYPHQAAARDLWRFSPDGLSQLLKSASLNVLESGWRLKIDPGKGIKNLSDGTPQEIYSCYAVGARAAIAPRFGKKFPLPHIAQDSGAVPSGRELPIPTPATQSTSSAAPRCLFLNTCYERFLSHHYQANPALINADYRTQFDALNGTFFGDSNFYSTGLNAAGFCAEDIVINCAPMQQQWAKEHGSSQSGVELVFAQIDAFKPDIVYIQDMSGATPEFISLLKERGILVAGQIACEATSPIPFEMFDIVFSSFVHYAEVFKKGGIVSYYQPLAFAPHILDTIGNRSFEERDIECSFIGGLSAYHSNGTKLLEKLAAETPIQIWGYGIDGIPAESPIRARHNGEAWGHEMFTLLNRSKITVNRHSEAASTNANNMRLFEATGCGALLITDYKDNLNQLFEIGKEVVAYRTPDECVALIKHYRNHPEEAKAIARAGQQRTLRDHSYAIRMQKTAEVLARHLSYRKNPLPDPQFESISTDFKALDGNPENPALLEGWKEKSVADSQRSLVQYELKKMFSGDVPAPFGTAAALLRSVVRYNASVLEIGCSSGYYYEVLEYLLNKKLRYTGADYSAPMIEMARQYYPQAQFKVADGAALPFTNNSFDIVISGCVLIHCPNYAEHINETCRVARKHILLHRSPISHTGQTKFFEKSAYGAKTVELWFGEDELLGLFAKNGFAVIDWIEYERDEAAGFSGVSYLLKQG